MTSKTASIGPDGYLEHVFQEKLGKKQQEKALNSFYLDPTFRGSMKILRRMFPPRLSLKDKTVRKLFISRAGMILSRWGLHKLPHNASANYKWIAWLCRHWDPDGEERPVCPPSIREPIISGWTVQYLVHPLNFAEDQTRHRDHECAWVTVTLFPGVSRAQQDKAFELARYLSEKPMNGKTVIAPRGGRPGCTEAERRAIFSVFEQVGLPRKGHGHGVVSKLRSIRKVIEKSSVDSINCLNTWSDSTIAQHYGTWRTSKGVPPRRYDDYRGDRKEIMESE